MYNMVMMRRLMKTYKSTTNVIKIARLAVFAFLAFAASMGLNALPVFAEDKKPDYRLQISPTQDNVGKIDPGETRKGSFNVQNTGNKAYEYTVSVAPFSFKNENYEQDFDTSSKYTVLTDWVTFNSEKGSVEPGEQSEVKYTIRVPSDAPGGLQSAAIMVTMTNSDEMKESGVQTVSRAAYPIYMNVGGDTEERGAVIENKIPSLIFNPPLVTSSVVENAGNIYAVATYDVKVYNVIGGKEVYSNSKEDNNGDLKPDTRVIFPETERYNEVEWTNAPKIGLFRVKQTVTIFDEVSEKEKIVFICPIWLILIFVAVIAIIVYKIVSGIMKRREENK